MKNKNKLLTIIATCAYVHCVSQQAPTGPSPSGTGTVNQANKAWYRGGNAALPGTENIFGTLWNSPIYTQTSAINHMKLNGTVSYPIAGAPSAPRDGFLLLTNNPNIFVGGTPGGLMGAASGAFSLLHLVGDDSPNMQTNGYRNWMRNGLSFNNNFDAAFVGVRRMPNTLNPPFQDDVSDFVLNWSDNPGSSVGTRTPDNLVFCFTSAYASSSGLTDLVGNSLYGRETMRHTSDGLVGIGPRFDNTWQPKSTLHQHQEDNASSWMQITNQYLTTPTPIQTTPTAINANNGFRWGILGDALAPRNGNAFIYNQEKRHIIFSTGYATPGSIAATNERFRITSLDNETTLPTGYGLNNPGGISTNFTRISVTEDPASSVTRPLSLLHLGYNTITPTNDGWRPWMDVGTFTAKGSDNVYVGLKQEAGTDRQDGVISWGDNITGAPVSGPDNFRFIFTSNTAAADAGSVANGLEALRMTPTPAKGVYTGVGGDVTNPYYLGSINPTQTLEVNSWNLSSDPGGSSGLRFTNLTDASPTTPNTGNMGVLAVDAEGDVVYVPGGVGAAVGNYCTTTPNPLIANDYEMPLGGFNYRFTGQAVPFDNLLINPNIDVVGIGYKCGAPMPAKLSVLQEVGIPVAVNTMTAAMINRDAGSLVGFMTFRAIGGIADGLNANGNKTNVGGEFNAANAAINYGVRGRALSGGIGISQNYGVFGEAQNGTDNYGVYGRSNPSSGGAGPNYAGFFDGDLVGTAYVTPSDRNLKKDILQLENSLDIISKLNPVSYNFDLDNHKDIGLNAKKQYGFISQEVKEILPDLTSPIVYPALYDDEGKVKREKQEYLGLNYDGFIAILTNAVKEQQTQITELKEMVKSLSGLSATSNVNNKSVSLTDKNAIVLNQNVPNPFAESTVINYNIPTTFTKAQIIFSTVDGKIIKVVEVTANGAGTLNVFADDLSHGIYTYTLVVDGKTIDTKKMAKQ
jgi:hypothetical protein